MEDVSLSEIIKLLQLPAWKHRHELYSVWVATRILNSASDHQITFPKFGGSIRFGFKEEAIAHISSTVPNYLLLSEKRSPLQNPSGKGRFRNVQPDYSVWTRRVPAMCHLVVEAKHYKKAAKKNFNDALVDYANAHQHARVLLVNYGPIGTTGQNLDPQLSARCDAIGFFAPGNHSELKRFRERIQAVLGEPVDQYKSASRKPCSCLVDVSGSMRTLLTDEVIEHYIEPNAGEIAFVDNDILALVPAEAARSWLKSHSFDGSTYLLDSVERLLRRSDSITVITDEEGYQSLLQLDPALYLTTSTWMGVVALVDIKHAARAQVAPAESALTPTPPPPRTATGSPARRRSSRSR